MITLLDYSTGIYLAIIVLHVPEYRHPSRHRPPAHMNGESKMGRSEGGRGIYTYLGQVSTHCVQMVRLLYAEEG